MAKPLNISTARKQLPAIFDRVTGRRGAKVVIRRRDGDREAVLVDRGYVEALEAASRRLSSEPDFRLVGSGEAICDVEEALAEIRAADATEAASRGDEVVPGPGGRSAR